MQPAVPLLPATPNAEEDTQEQQETEQTTTRNDIRQVGMDLLTQRLVVIGVFVDRGEDTSREKLEVRCIIDTV